MYKVAFVLLTLVCCLNAFTVSRQDQKLCGDELPATVSLLCTGQFNTNAAFTEARFGRELAERCCTSPCDTNTLLSFCQHLAKDN
ncbi:ilGF domain-containing protein [Trichonephila inaurata madagascariensis]|uniref:IlGF domain-containing protein n=1 Tax=Trichonephila inaurata madagascariensis TaxID=2747483 RepID=A0A8X6WWW4_9ARAC|nr:ilGF domain-containing protein [Trichonephila inaurata madagascariensis]